MINDKSIDAFTHHILNNINTETLNSLSSNQLTAIKEAIRATRPKKKHSVDIRGAINLFFIRYYFVFLMGRDQRISILEIEAERRENMALIWNFIFIIFVVSPFILLALIALYFLKIGMGIDIFPGEHMGGIFGL
ncbi:MAG: hypothetical protein HY757_03990 [Nitrospirae bacterium]|nr:hypothetical protein [Nitrospirota bacterium]